MLKNLTPHILNINTPEGMVELKPSGDVARVTSQITSEGCLPLYHEGFTIPIVRTKLGPVAGVPAPQEAVYLIVSRMVADALHLRNDILVPGPLVRDYEGRVIGCEGLSLP